jgi:hypothetical protein
VLTHSFSYYTLCNTSAHMSCVSSALSNSWRRAVRPYTGNATHTACDVYLLWAAQLSGIPPISAQWRSLMHFTNMLPSSLTFSASKTYTASSYGGRRQCRINNWYRGLVNSPIYPIHTYVFGGEGQLLTLKHKGHLNNTQKFISDRK